MSQPIVRNRLVVVGPLLLLLVIAGLLPSPSQASISQRLTGKTAQSQPSGEIAYLKAGDIWLRNLTTGQANKLTNDGNNNRIFWSPDGKFLTASKNDGTSWLINPADGQAKQLLYPAIAWFPDSQWLISMDSPGLFKFKVDGTDLVHLTNDWDIDDLTIAPDGSIFYVLRGTPIVIVRISPSGARKVVYTTSLYPSDPCGISLSAFSETLFSFTQRCSGHGIGLTVVDLQSNQTPLGICGADGIWAHYNAFLAFINIPDPNCDAQFGTYVLSILDYNRTSNQITTLGSGGEWVPFDWSPDDNWLVYSKYSGGVWVVSAQGGQAQQISPDGSNPAWRPIVGFTVTGRVADTSNNGLPDVSITTLGPTMISTISDSNGNYRLTGLAAGIYIVTPSKLGYAFLPSSRRFTVSSDTPEQTFTALTMPPPIADFNVSPVAGTAPLLVTLQNTSTGNYDSCVWDHGDGSIEQSCAQTMTHIYGTAGLYTQGLTVSGPGGTHTKTRSNIVVSAPASTDAISPTGEIVSPVENQQFTASGIHVVATAQDDIQGSGVALVDFFVLYNGDWFLIGQDTTAPYETFWQPPAGLQTQTVRFAIHVYDHAGNYNFDPHGTRRAWFQASTQENWVSSRAYLNQLALGSDGWEMCSMSSIAMVEAAAGFIPSDFKSMRNEAINAQSHLPAGPSADRVAAYLKSRGMQARVITTQDKTAHFNQIKAEIDAGRPVILNASAAGGHLTSAGHYIVVVGYADSPNTSERRITVYDPFGRWKGATDIYASNDATPDPPGGVKGRWVSYTFDDLGTIYSVTASAAAQAASRSAALPTAVPGTPPDELYDAPDHLVIYTGDGESNHPFQINVPMIIRR